jgi:hypothetical protein
MITGAYSIIYSTDPDADRSFFRDVLQFSHVEAGDGWLIFNLPLAELAVHPGRNNDTHEIYLLCDDIVALQEQLSGQNVPCGKVNEFPWGIVMRITLPGGGSIGIYQPRHVRPAAVT